MNIPKAFKKEVLRREQEYCPKKRGPTKIVRLDIYQGTILINRETFWKFKVICKYCPKYKPVHTELYYPTDYSNREILRWLLEDFKDVVKHYE